MLEIALKYKNEVIENDLKNSDNPKYKFLTSCSYLDQLEIETSDWKVIQRVSTVDCKVIGYFSATVNRDSYTISNLGIINYNLDKNSFVFSRDLEKFIDYLLYYKKFRKLTFNCYTDNPAIKIYDTFVEKFGGKIVGIREKHDRLLDGLFYDDKIYEIMRENYLQNRRAKDEY